MAGAQFEYDESGATAYYFFMSFLAMILIPMTYVLWPVSRRKADNILKSKKQERYISKWKTAVLAIGWCLLAFLAYRTSYLETEKVVFDPYEILEVDRGASDQEIKRQYRKLSLKFHPDKVDADPEQFIKISKAYETLTNEDSKRNWEMYGNPDGPGAIQFGIALPAWIVEKKTSFWVLVLYVVAIVIVLPAVVGTWWYKKVKYTGDDILMDTVRLYHWYLGTSSQLNVQRLIMIIGASGEFYSRHNNEIAEREEDKAPVEALIRKLGNVREKNREARISEGYSLKARTLLHAHFMRQHVPVKQLQDDQASIIRRCPLLLREMLTIISEMTLQLQGQQDQLKRTKTKRAKRNRRYRSPGVAAVAACMKLSQMVIQAVWDRGENSHPLLMLPYVTTNTVHFFRGRKTHIRGVRDFVQLPDGRRRGLLRDALSDGLSDDPNLTDDQYDEKVGERYDEVMAVCGGFPDLHMDVKFKVLGETETGYVTTNALVTAVISLKRKSLQDLIESQQTAAEGEDVDGKVDDAEKVASKHKPWEKNKKKKKGKPASNKPRKSKGKKAVAAREGTPKTDSVDAGEEADQSDGGSDTNEDKENKRTEKMTPRGPRISKRRVNENEESASQSEDEAANAAKDDDDDVNDEREDSKSLDDDDDEMWEKIQKEIRPREKILHDKTTETHLVYAPYFPKEKQEWWWVYMVEDACNHLKSIPQLVTTLKDEEEVELKFMAPSEAGKYKYTVWCRSDCYISFDQHQSLTLEVHRDDGLQAGTTEEKSGSEQEEDELSEDVSGFESTDEAD